MKMRRIVTGHDKDGRAAVAIDDVLDGADVLGGLATFAVIWKTISSPAETTMMLPIIRAFPVG